MSETISINTGPLVALSYGRVIDLMGQLSIRFICPLEVIAEVGTPGVGGRPAIDVPNWLEVISLDQPPAPKIASDIDPAEAAVIQLAIEEKADWVCIDESKARLIAKSMGIHVTGSLGLLGRLKRQGHIGSVGSIVETIRNAGYWYSPALVEQFLAAMGE